MLRTRPLFKTEAKGNSEIPYCISLFEVTVLTQQKVYSGKVLCAAFGHSRSHDTRSQALAGSNLKRCASALSTTLIYFV